MRSVRSDDKSSTVPNTGGMASNPGKSGPAGRNQIEASTMTSPTEDSAGWPRHVARVSCPQIANRTPESNSHARKGKR